MKNERYKPDFIVAGVARSATTWLYYCLQEHPECFLPKKKELHFFDNDNKYKKGISFYENHFKKANSNQLKGEITPRYILYEESIKRIKYHYPDIKLIVMLRDPVIRAYSQYCYFKYNKMKEWNKDFLTALYFGYKEDYILKSKYYEQIYTLYQYFSNSQVCIIFDIDIKNNPKQTISKLYDFLGVESQFEPTYIWDEKINYSKKEKAIPPKWLMRLNKFFSLTDHTDRKRRINIYHKAVYNRITKFIVRYLFRVLYKTFKYKDEVNKEEILTTTDTKIIYNHFFKEDIERLEHYLNVNLQCWKWDYK
jgi:hypothetical protein